MVRMTVLIVLAALLSACSYAANPEAASAIEVRVYKSPYCGCCGQWIQYMEDNGFEVTVEEVADMAPIKARYHVPPMLESCHTAVVEGYVVEGHVPVREINRMLNERPDILGIAVPGMPIGSPGMQGSPAQPFEVYTFDKNGQMLVYGSYPEY